MQCPKCQQDQNSDTLCELCGVVFAKYYKYHPPGDDKSLADKDEVVFYSQGEVEDRYALLLPAQADSSTSITWLRVGLLLLLTFCSLVMLASGKQGDDLSARLLHLVALPFHEAGHVFMRPFGSFMASAGGTLGQLAMPLTCALVLLMRTGDPFGAAVASWWFGQNFIDIAPYIADARAGQLPLIGGNFGHSSPYGFHDWEYLLTETGLIQHDITIANLSLMLGAVLMFAALGWGAIIVKRLFHLAN